MPPNTAQKIPDDAEFPSLGASRRTARKATSVPTPTNENKKVTNGVPTNTYKVPFQDPAKFVKKPANDDNAGNAYLPKPANDDDPEHLKPFQGNAEYAISKGLEEKLNPTTDLSKRKTNDNNPESKNTESAESSRNYRTPSEIFDRSKALYSAANDNNTQLNITKSRQEMNRKIAAVQGVLAKHGIEDISKREARNMIQHGFKHQFPAGMFALSVTKDFLFDPAVAVASLGLFGTGLATSASVVGAPVGMALSAAGIAFGIANTFIISPAVQGARIVLNRQYVSRLVGKDKVAKKIMRKILVGNVVTALVELPPILQLLPTHTVRTIMVNMLLAKILADCAAAAS